MSRAQTIEITRDSPSLTSVTSVTRPYLFTKDTVTMKVPDFDPLAQRNLRTRVCDRFNSFSPNLFGSYLLWKAARQPTYQPRRVKFTLRCNRRNQIQAYQTYTRSSPQRVTKFRVTSDLCDKTVQRPLRGAADRPNYARTRRNLERIRYSFVEI